MTQTLDKPTERLSGLTGLDLRAVVAVEIFGWQNIEVFRNAEAVWRELPNGNPEQAPHWESDRTAAQQVLERVKAIGRWIDLTSEIAMRKKLCPLETFAGIDAGLEITAEEICQFALSVIREQRAGGTT